MSADPSVVASLERTVHRVLNGLAADLEDLGLSQGEVNAAARGLAGLGGHLGLLAQRVALLGAARAAGNQRGCRRGERHCDRPHEERRREAGFAAAICAPNAPPMVRMIVFMPVASPV